MKLRFQFGEWVLTVACVAAMALPCAAQHRENNKPPQQQRQQQAPRQERRQPQQQGGRAQGGRPAKLDRKGLARLKRLLAAGKNQAECAAELGVSIRTIGRAVAGIERWSARPTSVAR